MDPALLAAVEAAAAGRLAPEWCSGRQLMQELRSSIQVLPTGCAAIDALLGGGLREGTVVEAAGETAGGKTQLCLCAAATTAFRSEPVLYIDTTGSFAPERVVRLAEVEAAGAGADGWGAPQAGGGTELASRVLGCISVVRLATVYELLTHLDRVEAALQQQQQQQQQGQEGQSTGLVQGGPSGAGTGAAGEYTRALRGGPRLLIVDSVSALLSTILGNNQHTQGTALLTAVGRSLKLLAERHSIAVLVTNHVTSAAPMSRAAAGTRFGVDGGGGGGPDRGASASSLAGIGGLKPALGEQWRPQPHMRIQLSLDDAQPPASGARVATLTASPLQACGQKVNFRITDGGLV